MRSVGHRSPASPADRYSHTSAVSSSRDDSRSVDVKSIKQISVSMRAASKGVGGSSRKQYGANAQPVNNNHNNANTPDGLGSGGKPEYPKVTRFCSIRMSAASLCAGFIITTAVCLLVTTFRFSMDAAQAIAERHAIAIASKAKNDVEALLSKPIGNIQGWQFAMYKGNNYALPSDLIRVSAEAGDNSTLTNWQDPYFDNFVAALRASNFTYEFVNIGWNDGNYAACKRMPGQQFQCRTFYWGDRPANGSGTSLATDFNYYQNYTFINTQTSRTTYDPRKRGFFLGVNQTRFAMRWSSIGLSAMPVVPLIYLNGALFNDTHFLGVASISFELSVVSSFLSSLVTTENTVSLLIDNDDMLLASSYANEPFMTRSLISRPYLSPVPTNCLTSDAANGASEDIMICRARLATYSFAPLRELAAREPELVASGESGTARRLKLDGVDYFVSVVPVVTQLADGMRWRFALFVPQNDIVGGIIKGRDIAIYISVAIIVVCIALCFVVLTLLLRPLSSVTESMYKLATLQVDENTDTADEGEESDDNMNNNTTTNKKKTNKKGGAAAIVESNLLEIAMIQCAFKVMSVELAKVKSFLPQSVLAQLYGSLSSDEEGEMDDADDGVTNESKSRPGQTEDGDEGTSDGHSDSACHATRTVTYDANGQKSSTDHNTDHKTVNSSTKRVYGGGKAGVLERQAAKSKRNGKVAQLNTHLSLSTRRVTMLSMNIVRYHAFVSAIDAAAIVSMSTDIVGAFAAAVNEHKGVLDGFQGDRFLASFNAVTAVGNHACAAAGAAISAGNALHAISSATKASTRADDSLLRMSSGIASAPAIVGNMGTQAVKRFTVLGPVVTTACALERLCKKYDGVQTLIAGSVVAETENAFELMRCDVVDLPSASLGRCGGAGGNKVRGVVAALMGVKSALMDEWMYTLEAGERGSQYGAINDAFGHFMRGDNVSATACLAKKVGGAGPSDVGGVRGGANSHHNNTLVEYLVDNKNDIPPANDCKPSFLLESIRAHFAADKTAEGEGCAEAAVIRRLASLLAANVDGQTYVADMADYYHSVVIGGGLLRVK